MRTLLLGGHGLLGEDIYRVMSDMGHDVFRPRRHDLDLMDLMGIQRALDTIRPEFVIHAAGYTNVAAAESNFEHAFDVNCGGTYNVIRAMNRTSATLVLISTDYVFDGAKRYPYVEEDEPSPVNKYGWTKFTSEQLVKSLYEKSYILRTSWLFGAGGECFPKIMLRRLQQGGTIQVVKDQRGSPTYTRDLAKNIVKLLDLPLGTYHVTNSGETTWYDLATLVARTMGKDVSAIVPVSSTSIDGTVRRPTYSVLSNNKWNNLCEPLRPYDDALGDFLSELHQ